MLKKEAKTICSECQLSLKREWWSRIKRIFKKERALPKGYRIITNGEEYKPQKYKWYGWFVFESRWTNIWVDMELYWNTDAGEMLNKKGYEVALKTIMKKVEEEKTRKWRPMKDEEMLIDSL